MRVQQFRRGSRPGAAEASLDRPLPPALITTTSAPLPIQGAGKALRITQVETTEAMRRVVAVSVKLGVPIEPPGQEQDPDEVLRLEIDGEASGIALEQVRGLTEHPRVEQRAGVTSQQLAEQRDQHREMATLLDDATSLDEGLDKARVVFGAVQRQAGDRLEEALAKLLQQPNLHPDKAARLLAYQRKLRAQEEKIKAEKEALAQKTKAATAAGKAKLAAARKNLELQRIRSDIKAGVPVPEEVMDAALSDADAADDADKVDDRRGQGR